MAKILVVEDDDGMREFLATLVAIMGHVCVQAADGRQGLDAALDQPPDLIITDLQMPRMGGFEFLLELQRHSALAHIPALIYTANGGEECAQRALDCNAYAVLHKPSAARVLLASIRAALEGRPAACEQPA